MTVTSTTYHNMNMNSSDSCPLEAELEDDLTWAQSRPGVVLRHAAHAHEQEEENATANTSQNCYERALTDWECRSLKAYRDNWPSCCYSLAQNGATGFAMKSTEQFMHTLIRNLGFVWSDEIAGSQGQLCEINMTTYCFLYVCHCAAQENVNCSA